ncbi:UNVERIFIED_CONTAM: hypothetical protein K2H54_056413 [Gekko kuhli]
MGARGPPGVLHGGRPDALDAEENLVIAAGVGQEAGSASHVGQVAGGSAGMVSTEANEGVLDGQEGQVWGGSQECSHGRGGEDVDSASAVGQEGIGWVEGSRHMVVTVGPNAPVDAVQVVAVARLEGSQVMGQGRQVDEDISLEDEAGVGAVDGSRASILHNRRVTTGTLFQHVSAQNDP